MRNRSFYASVLGLLLAVAGFGVSANAEAASCTGFKVTTGGLNVRTSPSTRGTVVGVIHRNERYIATGAKSGGWRQIWFNHAARWIYASGYTSSQKYSCGTVTASTLNVRSGPGTGYRIVGTTGKGAKWAVIESRGAWRRIWYASERRWVHGGYLNQSVPVPKIELTGFNINKNTDSTSSRYVSAYSTTRSSQPRYYRISEDARFSGASWKRYSSRAAFTLSAAAGRKRVYFQVKNAQGRLSNVRSDTITYTPPPPPSSNGFRVDRQRFLGHVRASFGSLRKSQVDGINYLLSNIEKDTRPAIKDKTVWMRQIAYLFSTVKHEVANTYQPITEYSKTTCVRYQGGCTYKGRGYVQLTHRSNYAKMSPIVGVDLVAYPKLALRPDIAYTVMSHGMYHGMFTGRRLGDYIKRGTTDYYNARRVVNGLDRASLLSGYARSFQTALERSTVAK
ncbi:SH3 domain-containing protein [Alkalilimnicola sp. S0819]|uniref:SH3 domain-containing protein n=1 Tax=Alkalilimnicola sp. S0819 TaxID=2613922 RepID=UPI00186AAD82|nr:SH3 domain-containing protein [Alkalilimnicola sp. S0819]